MIAAVISALAGFNNYLILQVDQGLSQEFREELRFLHRMEISFAHIFVPSYDFDIDLSGEIIDYYSAEEKKSIYATLRAENHANCYKFPKFGA
jgi:hypothetical protein